MSAPPPSTATAPPEPHVDEFDEELLPMHLEPDQFVAETSRPVPRASLSARARTGLWALRVFAVAVSVMIVYTFVASLH
jgi:hypothetical protein